MARLRKKGRGFTLIELIAVLVIMAIIALIVTPLVMNIIRKARISADKRSIDVYGRSIELAIASYLLDTGTVYLTGCTVAGRTVDYAYGTDKTPPDPTYTAYSVGDHVSYNNVTYYVIEDSGTASDTVKLLKENPLTKTEMDNLNLTGITISEENGYGIVKYGESVDYSTSTVKQVVDVWKNTAVKSGDSATARLIKYNELLYNLGYENNVVCTGACYYSGSLANVPSWVYNTSYAYWTMSQNGDSSSMWMVNRNGRLDNGDQPYSLVVRPVLELSKSADITIVS